MPTGTTASPTSVKTSSMQSVIASLKNVSKNFGEVEAVRDVSFQIKKGDVIGFVGPNGAGKTTTISMMLGFISPSSGSLELFGERVTTSSAHRQHSRIGYIAGDMALPLSLTGAQYTSFMANQNGRDNDLYTNLASRLHPVFDKKLHDLSRGNRQKVALIAALQHKPELLVLDEPTSGLDPLMQDLFLEFVADANKNGASVLMSTHILSEVSTVCHRVICMKNGSIVMNKTIKDITSKLGKHIEIESSQVKTIVKHLPEYAALIRTTDTNASFSVDTKDIKNILSWLVTKNIRDITITEHDLDDVFRDLYETKRGNR